MQNGARVGPGQRPSRRRAGAVWWGWRKRCGWFRQRPTGALQVANTPMPAKRLSVNLRSNCSGLTWWKKTEERTTVEKPSPLPHSIASGKKKRREMPGSIGRVGAERLAARPFEALEANGCPLAKGRLGRFVVAEGNCGKSPPATEIGRARTSRFRS